MHRTLLPSRAAGPIVAAVLGGGFALGGAAALGRLGRETTGVREEMAATPSAPPSFPTGRREPINGRYRPTAPAVGHIETTSRVSQAADPFFGNPFGTTTQTQRALGSGFVIDKAGHIVTNYHVIRGANAIQVSFSNNERYRATLVGSDASTDIAVL